MPNFNYYIKFHSYWLQAEKDGQSLAADMVTVKDNGKPIVGGKAVKGLIRENLILLYYINQLEEKDKFVVKNKMNLEVWSQIKVHTARIPGTLTSELMPYLYNTITSTALEKETKNAISGSLRTAEVVVPLSLAGTISIPQNELLEITIKNLKKAVGMIKEMGMNRYNGWGRCTITID